jgi:hypothetical protein
MSGPDFRELIGNEGTPEELAKLRHAHELLIAAGPPPELSPSLAEPPPSIGRVTWLPRRRRGAVFALAAGIVAAAFGVGFLVGDRGSNEFPSSRSLEMNGVAELASAHATLGIAEPDNGGNYPLQMTVRGLPEPPKGGWYELLLSKHGRPTLSCGSFAVDGQAVTVRLSIPYDLSKFPDLFDGWVVVEHVPGQKHVPVVMTT